MTDEKKKPEQKPPRGYIADISDFRQDPKREITVSIFEDGEVGATVSQYRTFGD